MATSMIGGIIGSIKIRIRRETSVSDRYARTPSSSTEGPFPAEVVMGHTGASGRCVMSLVFYPLCRGPGLLGAAETDRAVEAGGPGVGSTNLGVDPIAAPETGIEG